MTNLKAHLAKGELLQWSGTPRQGLVLRRSDALLIPFSLMWGGFAIFWEAMAIRESGSFFAVLWGIPFVLIGLYIMIGRFFHDAAQRARMEYGVTDQRIIIVRGRTGSLTSLELAALGEVSLDVRADGSGTIAFGPLGRLGSMPPGFSSRGTQQPLSFDLIPDATRVYEIIREAKTGPISQRAI